VVSHNGRSDDSQRQHDAAVRMIADDRFNVDEWDVTVNPSREENAAMVYGGAAVYPDIVARHDDQIVAVGEVETHESLSDAEVEQWRAFGGSCPRLYLFVPEGAQDLATDLIRRHSISCAGLRTYALGKKDAIRIESVSVQDAGIKPDTHPWWRDLGAN
jgi:hypothetical protein